MNEDTEPNRMTYRQLAEWLIKGNGQWAKMNVMTSTSYAYDFSKDEFEVPDDYKIRYWGCDRWIEPTEREYLVAVKHVNPGMTPAEWHSKETCI